MMAKLVLFVYLLIVGDTALSVNETEGDTTVDESCPPLNKRQRTEASLPQCFIKEFGIDLDKNCSTDPPEILSGLQEFEEKTVDEINGLIGIANEADLILSRAGIFDYQRQPLQNLRVCSNHKDHLGKKFAKSRPRKLIKGQRVNLCKLPHVTDMGEKHPDGVTRVANRNTFVTKEQAQVFMEKNGILAPVGDAMCLDHYNYIQDLVSEHRWDMKGYDLRNPPRHPLATAPYNAAGLQHIQQEHGTCFVKNEEVVVPTETDTDTSEDESNNRRRKQLRKRIRELARAANVGKVHFSRNFHELSKADKLRRASAAERLCKVIIEEMAMDAPNELKRLMQNKEERTLLLRQHTERADSFLDSIGEAFLNAPSSNIKRQTLSLVALYVPYRDLIEYIPTLTLYYYKQARRHAKVHGSGTFVPTVEHTRERYSKKKVDMFIEFITSPYIVIDLPYGVASVKRGSGKKEDIPNLIRLMNDEHIITQYLAMLNENGEEQYALSRSSLRRILAACPAETRKSLQGLDAFLYAGTNGFDELAEIVTTLGERNSDLDWANEFGIRLRNAKQYLKQQYKLHVQLESPVSDHCIKYALSDPKKEHFAAPCESHDHESNCPNCNDLRLLLSQIKTKIQGTPFLSERLKAEVEYTFSNAETSIWDWKKHIIRSVLQDTARINIMKELKPDEVFLHLDWSMKWLPAAYREDQKSFFGKRGISWHITVATTKVANPSNQDDPRYETHTFVHVFDYSQQDAKTVIAILGDVMKRIHNTSAAEVNGQQNQITKAYIRADNAGCYHSGPVIAAMPQLKDSTGITVVRVDFSDPQAGKGACDRAAASIKRQIRMYINEGHDATNALEFINCATAHGRIKHTSFIYADVEAAVSYKQASIPQITTYNNFLFEPGKISAWRAYNIGDGYSIPSNLWANKQSVPNLAAKEGSVPALGDDTWKIIHINAPEQRVHEQDHEEGPHDEHHDEAEHEESEQECSAVFYCPEEGCTSSFSRYSNLLKHIENGRHTFTTLRQDIREYSIDSYKTHIERMPIFQNAPSIKSAIQELSLVPTDGEALPKISKGWALAKRKPSKQFTKAQRAFLIEKFDLGITAKKKQDAAAVAKAMRADLRFERDEWLTEQQIKSFWCSEAQRRRKEIPKHPTESPEEIDTAEIMQDPDPYVDDYMQDLHQMVTDADIFLQN